MIAALINRFGDSIDAIAIHGLSMRITGNAAWSAIIYGVNRIPSIISTYVSRTWVEGQKKTIMIVTDLIRCGQNIAFVATGGLFGFCGIMLLVTTLTISTVEVFWDR